MLQKGVKGRTSSASHAEDKKSWDWSNGRERDSNIEE